MKEETKVEDDVILELYKEDYSTYAMKGKKDRILFFKEQDYLFKEKDSCEEKEI